MASVLLEKGNKFVAQISFAGILRAVKQVFDFGQPVLRSVGVGLDIFDRVVPKD